MPTLAGERSRGLDVAFVRPFQARTVTRPAEARGHPIRVQALRSRQNHSATRRKLPPTWRRGRPTPVPSSVSPSVVSPATRTGRRNDFFFGPCEPGGADEANYPRGGRLGPRGNRGSCRPTSFGTHVIPSPLRSAEPLLPAIQETRTVPLNQERNLSGPPPSRRRSDRSTGPEDPLHSAGVTRPKISGPHGHVVRERASSSAVFPFVTAS